MKRSKKLQLAAGKAVTVDLEGEEVRVQLIRSAVKYRGRTLCSARVEGEGVGEQRSWGIAFPCAEDDPAEDLALEGRRLFQAHASEVAT